MIWIIARREFQTLFVSPLAWSILATLQFLLAYIFLGQIESFIHFQAKLANLEHSPGLTDVVIVPLFHATTLVLLLVTPLLTMRLICEERRTKTLALLLASPVSETQIVLGKYIAVIGFLLIISVLIGLMPLSLLIGGELDYGKCLTNFIGLCLAFCSFAAVGLYMSTIANHTLIAALGSICILLLLWILNWQAALSNHQTLLGYLSILPHLQALQSGLINTADVSYFVLLSSIFLILAIRRLSYERLGL